MSVDLHGTRLVPSKRMRLTPGPRLNASSFVGSSTVISSSARVCAHFELTDARRSHLHIGKGTKVSSQRAKGERGGADSQHS